MHILTIMGSLRKHGNTDQAVQLISEHLRAAAKQQGLELEIDTLALGSVQVDACHGCRACFDRGEEKCPHHDDLHAIRQRFAAADAVLIASPIYVDDVNGATKNLIDRLAYICHRPAFAGKCAFALVTVAGSPTSHALRTLGTALQTWGFHVVGQAGWKMGPRMQSEEARALFEDRARQIAERIIAAVHRQEYRSPSFLALMTFSIQQATWRASAPDTIDYAYWHNQGWLAPGCTFYIPHRANALKVWLARWVGKVILRFLS